MSIIKLEKVAKSFAKMSVLNSLDLELGKGQVLGLLGHNGAGKTTTMKMILGLLKPSSGEVRVFGQDPALASFSHYRYQIGFLPENVSFYQQLTGLEVLFFFAKLKRVSKQRCIELLEQVGLAEAANRKVKNYSKGMKQRLGLAQAILTEPSLLLLDEPTVGLDPIATQDFYGIVDRMKKNGCSIILCSHVLPGIEKHLDKVAILSKGNLVAHGSIPTLREQTKLPTRVSFSGYFDLQNLENQLDKKITNLDGQFSIETSESEKLSIMGKLLTQPGIQNIDTFPANLEQLYYHFIQPSDKANDTTLSSATADMNTSVNTSINVGEQQ